PYTSLTRPRAPPSPLFPYTTLFRSDAAAHEHAAAFHVNRAHRIAEQHHAQHHPGSWFSDSLLGDAADVEHRRRQIVEDHGSGITDRKSTRLNSSHRTTSYAVFCLKK